MLDACAAPGGKSVLLAKKCGGVTAFELHPHRVELIRQYRERMGTANVFEKQKDSSVFDSAYAEKFDGVLCDVPCSGFGTLSENPDIRLFRKEGDFASLAAAQRGILAACARYVRRGGRLYYATCSVFAEENDLVVGEFLAKNPDFSPCGRTVPAVRAQKIRFAVSAGRGVRRRFLRREAGEEMKGEA